MRGLPFFKPKNKPQFAGLNFSETSSGGGGGGGSSLFDYSTDEFQTHQKWIDGKDIFGKVLHITEGSFGGGSSYAHGISDLGDVVFTTMIVESDGNYFINDYNNGQLKIMYVRSRYVDFVGSGGSVSASSKPITIILFYTKNS